MIILQEKAFFNWLRNNSSNHWNFTDVKSVHDWTLNDRKLKHVESIDTLINLMQTDTYYTPRHIGKVHRAYEYYCQRVIGGKIAY